MADNAACTLGTHNSYEERIGMCNSMNSYCTATFNAASTSSMPGTCAANNRKAVGVACTYDAECVQTAYCHDTTN